MCNVYIDSSGQRLTVQETKYNKIFDVSGYPDKLAKIHDGFKQRISQKRLREMAKMRAELEMSGTLGNLAWPESLIFSPDDRDRANVVGYVMTRAKGCPVHRMFDGKDRLKYLGATTSWENHLAVAASLAGTMCKLHEAGIIIGDFNAANFLVSEKDPRGVALIDCDSFQLLRNGALLCGGGVVHQDYYAPELFLKDIGKIQLNKEVDHYGLACYVFRLLFCGVLHRAPRRGGERGGSRPWLSAFESEGYLHRKSALKAEDLPERVMGMLRRGLGTQPLERPTAEEWKIAIDEMTRPGGLKRCSDKEGHVFAACSPGCPWCRYEKRSGHDWFAPGP